MTKGYHHLTRDERCQIYTLRKRGDSLSTIANEIEVNRSTVSRELKRNKGKKGYRYTQAHEQAKSRRSQASSHRIKMTNETIRLIEEKINMQWSPEQISGWMKKECYEIAVSHETIYQHIWKSKKTGRLLHKELRHKGKKYNKRGSKQSGRGVIPRRVGIEKRPAIVEKKERIGDWELDTIIGSSNTGAIVSMVDRGSKYTKLAIVPTKTASEVTNALIKKLGGAAKFVLTMTADNGKEFADHEEISEKLKANFYFANPYHSWERGLNEHTNGLVRQYLPKGTKFDNLLQERLTEIECLLNNRPRKVLNFLTPPIQV